MWVALCTHKVPKGAGEKRAYPPSPSDPSSPEKGEIPGKRGIVCRLAARKIFGQYRNLTLCSPATGPAAKKKLRCEFSIGTVRCASKQHLPSFLYIFQL